MAAGFCGRLRQGLGRLPVDLQQDAAIEDLLDLLRVDEAVAAGQHAGVEDDAVEDVVLGNGEHVLDLPDLLPVAGKALGPLAKLEV